MSAIGLPKKGEAQPGKLRLLGMGSVPGEAGAFRKRPGAFCAWGRAIPFWTGWGNGGAMGIAPPKLS